MSRIYEEIQKAHQIKEWLISEGEEDPELAADMIEGETDLKDLLEWSLRKYGDEQVFNSAVDERKKELTKRKASSDVRLEKLKEMMGRILEAWGHENHKGIDGTVGITKNPPKPIILDETLLPDIYVNIIRTPRKADINDAIKAGAKIEGVGLDNGSQSITVRMK